MRIERHILYLDGQPSCMLEVDGVLFSMYADGGFHEWGQVKLEWKRTPLDSLLGPSFRWWYTFI